MRVLHTVTALVVISAIGTIAAPASAQVVDVRVKVDTQAIREATEEIREALREVFGPEMRREMTGLSREVAAAVEHLARSPWLGDGGWVDSMRQRNFPAQQTDKETRTFAIGASGEFDLDNLSGDIRIEAGSGRNLTIQITRSARGRTEADARNGLTRVRVETTHRGDRATARTVYPNERQSDYSVTVDYVVTAPAGTRITARAVSGDVTVGAITGEVAVHTTSGDVRVTGATRLVSAKTISGDITLLDTRAEGLLEAGTMSGDVTATNVSARRLTMSTISGDVSTRNVEAGDVKMNTMSGDVRFDGAIEPRGRYDFTSQSGTVRLSLDGRTGFSLEAQTFNGSVTTELELKSATPGAAGRRPARQLRGTFGDGSATITARSFSGSVVLVRR
jgi:hypothetical protein